MAEATYLTRETVGARAALIEMIGEEFLAIGMALTDHHSAILRTVKLYRDLPMSLADACLVRLTKLHPQRGRLIPVAGLTPPRVAKPDPSPGFLSEIFDASPFERIILNSVLTLLSS